MSDQVQTTNVVRFGAFEVDLRTAELRKLGVRMRLPGQSFQVLEALLLRPGELVTREELKQKLWPSDTFGDFEHGLNAAVNRVREALGDSSDNPRFVETIPRRGYRFIAPVENGVAGVKVPLEAAPITSQDGQEPASVAAQSSYSLGRRWIPAVIALLLLLFAVGSLLFVRFRDRVSRDVRPAPQQDLHPVPLTTLPGREVSPSFSPDGSQVAFAWDGGNSHATTPFNLYVKAFGSEKIEQLTHEPAYWIVPAWSPDGSTIAFAREGGEKQGIFSIPVRGGPERKLADANFAHWGDMALSWSPDGRQLLYYTSDGIRVLTPENGEVRAVDAGPCEPRAPALSPDGKWIAFTCEMNGTNYLDLLSTKSGTSKHLIRREEWGPLAWTNDNQRIIFGALWEININGGESRQLMFAKSVDQPAIAARGDRLAYVARQEATSIRRAETRTGSTWGVLAPATVEQGNPHISPDGKRVAFESERSGSHEVWVANLDGSDAVQLSNFHERLTGTPRWSPDGRWIAFDSRVSGKAALYIVDPATALPRQIPTNNIPAAGPNWSKDGKWIYFTSQSPDPAEHNALYRVHPEGGTPERVAQAHGINAQESRDGKLLYFADFAPGASEASIASIYVLNIATGEQQPLADMPKLGCGNDWVLGSKGIFFSDFGQQPAIDFFDFFSHRVTRKIPLDKPPDWWGGLSLAPDETWLAFSQADQSSSDLMLVEGFR